MIESEQYQELINKGSNKKPKISEKEIKDCLETLGYQYESCKAVKKLINENPNTYEDNTITDFQKLVEKGNRLKSPINKETIEKCIPKLGYEIEKFSDPIVPPSDSVCEEVENKIKTENYAVGKYILRRNYDDLLEIVNNDETKLNKCLTNLNFQLPEEDCVMVLEALTELNFVTSTNLTSEQYGKLLESFSKNKTMTEEEKNNFNQCLTKLGYTVAEQNVESKLSSDAAEQVSTGVDSDLSQDASSTVGSNPDPNPSVSTAVDSNLSQDASTGNDLISTQDASSTVVSNPDPNPSASKEPFGPNYESPLTKTPSNPNLPEYGMYHGCEYKGYKFKVNDTGEEVTYTDNLDTIIRYYLFSNIVVFIVN